MAFALNTVEPQMGEAHQLPREDYSMATKKKGTLTKVGAAVKKVTKKVADALGVKKKTKKPAARMTGVAKSAKTGSAKKSTVKKATAKKTASRKK
jgi:hypothetical protein